MTKAELIGHRHTPLAIPIASLLAPQPSPRPAQPLPSPSAAVLGPLPPTTPLHLALNFIALSDLPEYDYGQDTSERTTPRPESVLIITGPQGEFRDALEEEDEDWMRDHGGNYDYPLESSYIRYCPTARHLLLLLTLLSEGKEGGPQAISRPGLVILWNIAGLLMEDVAVNENAPDPQETLQEKEKKRFSEAMSHYMDLIAAARAMVQHLSSLDSNSPPTQLIILEPHLDAAATLPIFPGGYPVETSVTMPKATREKRIAIDDGLAWMLGKDAVGTVTSDPDPLNYHLSFPDLNESMNIRKRRCKRGEWASAAAEAEEVDEEGVPMVEGDQGGWRWEWC